MANKFQIVLIMGLVFLVLHQNIVCTANPAKKIRKREVDIPMATAASRDVDQDNAVENDQSVTASIETVDADNSNSTESSSSSDDDSDSSDKASSDEDSNTSQSAENENVDEDVVVGRKK